MSLWDDPMLKNAFDNLSSEDKLKYKIVGEQMYSTIDYNNPAMKEFNYASKIYLMLRDGLLPSHLSPEEKKIFITTYGESELNKFVEPKIIKSNKGNKQ